MIENKTGIPGKPGVYLFKAGDRVLYIGKAKDLKKRVDQYFHHRDDRWMLGRLMEQADSIECIVTDHESDALLLEYNLVHHYQPPFNIKLKDDKSFPYIEITTGANDFPAVYFSRKTSPGCFYAGPVVNSRKARELIDLVTRLFKLRTCADSTFKRGTPCLYHYIDRCSAPCSGSIGAETYRSRVNDAISFLKGNKKKTIARQEQKMAALAEQLKFEEAEKVKEDIALIDQFSLESYISSVKNMDYDVIALHKGSEDQRGQCFIILFSVLEGRVKRKEFFDFPSLNTTEDEILKEFLISFYRRENIPREVSVYRLPAEHESLEIMFSRMAGRKITIKQPRKGPKRKNLDLALRNLNLYVNRTRYRTVGESLKNALHLQKVPEVIEAVDISHFSERDRVGAVVVFQKGQPAKKHYRSYAIKKAAPGDTEAMKEVLERRYSKLESMPDLLLIDGGLPQLGAALSIKKDLGLTFDMVALAKKEERLYMENGDSIVFPDESPESFLVRNIRDEVHRRAITHHRKRREKI